MKIIACFYNRGGESQLNSSRIHIILRSGSGPARAVESSTADPQIRRGGFSDRDIEGAPHASADSAVSFAKNYLLTDH